MANLRGVDEIAFGRKRDTLESGSRIFPELYGDGPLLHVQA